MTGADIASLFQIKCDEVQSDYYDNTTIQAFCDEAVSNIYMTATQQYELNNRISVNLVPFIRQVTVSTPTSNLVDISATSTDVPNYEQLINLQVAFIVDGDTYRNEATIAKGGNVLDYYERGSLRYPKYQYYNNKLKVLPEGYQVNEAVLQYIRTCPTIDITDAFTDLDYRDEFLHLVVTEMASIAGIPKKSTFDLQVNQGQEIKNKL